MNGILGMLQLLDNIDLEEEYAEYLAEAFKAGGRMHKLVEDLISVTRLENHTLMLVPVSLRTLRNVFVHTLNPMAREKGLIVRDGMDPECPSIMISDVDLLRMVLIKLGENAIKFTDQGSVELHIGAESKADDVYLFRFTVTDTGRGIAEENIDTVVSGLAQEETALNRHFGGLGLGIEAIRKALVLLGGGFEHREQPREGGAFRCQYRIQGLRHGRPGQVPGRGVAVRLKVSSRHPRCKDAWMRGWKACLDRASAMKFMWPGPVIRLP